MEEIEWQIMLEQFIASEVVVNDEIRTIDREFSCRCYMLPLDSMYFSAFDRVLVDCTEKSHPHSCSSD
jgi:hypothetical protein